MEQSNSPWTDFLRNPNVVQHIALDDVAVQLETTITNLMAELRRDGRITDPEEIKRVAINLTMQQLIQIQHDQAPAGFKAMMMAFIMESPLVADLRSDMANQILKQAREDSSFKARMKKAFKFL